MSKIYMNHTPAVQEVSTTVSTESEDGSTEIVVKGLESVEVNMHALSALSDRDAAAAMASLESELINHSKLFDNAARVYGMLRSAQGPMTHHQASMMAVAASNAGIPLAHAKSGMGLEAYTGERHVVYLKASVESVGDWIMKWLDKLAELWERFVGWLTKALSPSINIARILNKAAHDKYSNYSEEDFATLKLKLAQPRSNMAKNLADIFYIDGDSVDVGKSITTFAEFFHDLAGPFSDHLKKSVEAAVSSAKDLCKLKGNQWRKDDMIMSKVKEFEFPIPKGYVKHKDSASGAMATYRSMRMPGGFYMLLTCPEAGSHRGHRGAKEYLKAFESIKVEMAAVPVPDHVLGNVKVTLEDIRRLPTLTQAALDSVKLVTTATYLSAEARQGIRQAKSELAGSDIDETGAAVIRDLLDAARKMTQAAATQVKAVTALAKLTTLLPVVATVDA